MIYVLMGKTCSGKTTLVKELERQGIKAITSITTRPPREGEIAGKDYHFINDDAFKILENLDALVGINHFSNAFGTTWSYSMMKKDFPSTENQFVILTPSGYEDFIKEFGKENVIGIYLDVDLITRIFRGRDRGDDKNEFKRRLYADEIDFKNLKADVMSDDPEFILNYIKKRMSTQ